jgi:hypothetical protein
MMRVLISWKICGNLRVYLGGGGSGHWWCRGSESGGGGLTGLVEARVQIQITHCDTLGDWRELNVIIRARITFY